MSKLSSKYYELLPLTKTNKCINECSITLTLTVSLFNKCYFHCKYRLVKELTNGTDN